MRPGSLDRFAILLTDDMMRERSKIMRGLGLLAAAVLAFSFGCSRSSDGGPSQDLTHDIVIRRGLIFDGLGGAPKVGDVAIDGDRIVAVAERIEAGGRREIDAAGLAVAPGFINPLSWSGESLIEDGRGLSALYQGVTLEVVGEGVSMGPLTEMMKQDLVNRQRDIRYPVSWSTLGEYFDILERKGIGVNLASYVGAATVRWNVLGADDVKPNADEIKTMRRVVQSAMEDGALGVASSLIYPPGVYADTDELVSLARAAGACGGVYATHMRSEGNLFLEALDEAIDISKRAEAPAHIFHLKVGGRENWPKMKTAINTIDQARRDGHRITADMYPYVASGTGLSASMPPWVQQGGQQWISRLRDPDTRARVIAEMQDEDAEWENVMRMAGGGEYVLLAEFKNPELKHLVGKTLSEVAKERGVSDEEAAVMLVLEDGSRVNAIYYTMSEENLDRQVVLPYMSFSTDGVAMATEGVFLKSATHPRSYGSFPRVFSQYVTSKNLLSAQEAVRRMTSQPAKILGLKDRGQLNPGYIADVVIFDLEAFSDNATFLEPHKYASGMLSVIVNGQEVIRGGAPTGALPGRIVKGRAWSGWSDGGCRTSSSEWGWARAIDAAQ